MLTERLWKTYTIARFILSPIDILTDVIHACHLYKEGHPYWASLTLAIPFISLVLAFTSVLVGKIRQGDPLPCKKFILLTIDQSARFYEPMFESAPQLVLQLTGVWRGAVDISTVFVSPDFFGVVTIVTIVSSFSSIVVTALFVNNEKWNDCARFTLGLSTSATSIILRVFVASLLFAVSPFWATGVMALTYVACTVTFMASSQKWESLLFGYSSLLFPSGYSDAADSLPGKTLFKRISSRDINPASHYPMSEVRRVRISQEALLKRVRISYGLFNVVNVVLMVAFAAIIETHLFGYAKSRPVIELVTDRLVLYLVPVCHFLVILFLSMCYCHRVEILRDAARIWDRITPSTATAATPSAPSRPSVSTASAETPTCPPPPYDYEQQLPLNPDPNSEPQSSAGKAPRPGNRRCDRESCTTCDLLITGSSFKSLMTGKVYKFMPSVNCSTKNVIYLVTCEKCRKQYVGKTEQELRQRHYGHRREIDKSSSFLGQHFSGPCGYVSFRIQIIDHTSSRDGLQRREGYWQHELMTLLPWGLNSRDELSGVDINVMQAVESPA